MTNRIRRRLNFILKNELYPNLVEMTYDPADEALEEPLKIAKRLREYMMAQPTPVDGDCLFMGLLSLNHTGVGVPSDLFPRHGHTNFAKVCGKYYNNPQENLCTFEWQHSTPDHNYVIHHGLEGLRQRIEASRLVHKDDPEKLTYLQALEECIDMDIAWAHKNADACLEAAKTADPQRKAELERIAANLYWVPEHPARSFYEAVQCLYLCFDFLSDSVGTIDRYLWDFYQADLASGALTREQAKEYLQDLFLKLQSRTPLTSDRRARGGECHFAIGGYLPDGTDGFNDLSRLIVEALMELPTNIPEISLRRTDKTPYEVLRFMLDCERHDPNKRIALANDEPRIRGFMDNLGMRYEDAVSYTMVGCNEPAFPGTVWKGGNTVNIARSLTNTLYNRKEDAIYCPDFDSFYALYEEELQKDLDRILEYSYFFDRERGKDINILSALFLEGCIENASSPTRDGCRIKLGGFNLMGLISVVDSLAAVKQFVYEEKYLTMAELIQALEANWEGFEALRQRILQKGRFFGNNDPLSNEIAQRFCRTLQARLKDRRLLFGEKILLGNLTGYNPHYAFFGNRTAATPDGRHAGDAFMVGIGQTGGKDREGLTSLLCSVAQFDPVGIFCGPTVTNVLLDEALVRNDSSFEKLVQIIDTYFKLGGLHIQLNYVSKETLLAAKETPEDYASLKVRVSGFSGYFTQLCAEIQDDVIARTSIGK